MLSDLEQKHRFRGTTAAWLGEATNYQFANCAASESELIERGLQLYRAAKAREKKSERSGGGADAREAISAEILDSCKVSRGEDLPLLIAAAVDSFLGRNVCYLSENISRPVPAYQRA